MTNSEFSNQFDVLYNNIMSNQAPGLDEYEKSVFLTKAQTDIILSYFNPRSNKVLEGFDDSAKRQIDFSNLMTTAELDIDANPTLYPITSGAGSISFDDLEEDEPILIIINEVVVVTPSQNDNQNDNTNSANSTSVLSVVPISNVEFTRLLSKPFKRPPHYQAWRLITSDSTADIIMHPGETGTYKIRYIRRPLPIILADLGGLTIDGYEDTDVDGSEVDPILHQDILQRAVELAKAAYTGDLQSQLVLGNNSGTEKGMVAVGGK